MCKYIEELKKQNYTKNKIGEIAKKFGLKEDVFNYSNMLFFEIPF